MSATCAFQPTGTPACGKRAVAEVYEGTASNYANADNYWRPLCGEHIAVKAAVFYPAAVPLDLGPYVLSMRALPAEPVHTDPALDPEWVQPPPRPRFPEPPQTRWEREFGTY